MATDESVQVKGAWQNETLDSRARKTAYSVNLNTLADSEKQQLLQVQIVEGFTRSWTR